MLFGEMINRLKANPKKIVFTEGTDPRILEAASRLLAGYFLPFWSATPMKSRRLLRKLATTSAAQRSLTPITILKWTKWSLSCVSCARART